MSSLTNSPSRSDPGADALPSNAANILSEQVQLFDACNAHHNWCNIGRGAALLLAFVEHCPSIVMLLGILYAVFHKSLEA